MSKKHFKTQANSSRVGFGQPSSTFGSFSASGAPAFGSAGSALSYLAEQPDLSSLSDSNIVVNFKNLSKKDEKTKAKALEELQSWISIKKKDEVALEESFLDAWTKVYPRMSIDVSRRVRQLAHSVHGQACSACGKRVARHMPAVVGPWLCGKYDGDKTVALAAQAALTEVFPTPDKQENLLKVFQSSIASFVQDAIFRETPETLSDERTTTKEDSQAKYSRLVACSIAVLTSLLAKLERADIEKESETYQEILSKASLWSMVSSKDVQLRRSVMRLLRACIERHQDLISAHLELIREAFLSKSSLRNQSLSSVEFVETLTNLAHSMPSFWQDLEQTPIFERLQILLKQGSQSGPAVYWDRLVTLFATLQVDKVRLDNTLALKVMESMRVGISRKDEPKASQESAWSSYFGLADIIARQLSNNDSYGFLQQAVTPSIRQSLHAVPERAEWTISSPKSVYITSKALKIVGFEKVARALWPELTNELIQHMQASLPEQSKDFTLSQDSIKLNGERWFTLQKQALHKDLGQEYEDVVGTTTRLILQKAIDQIQARNGKPYGAAATVNAALNQIGAFIVSRKELHGLISSFLVGHIKDFLFSPSASYLISSFYHCQEDVRFEHAWNEALSTILNTSDGPAKTKALWMLLDTSKVPQDFKLAVESRDLQAYILRQARHSLESGEGWPSSMSSSNSSSLLSPETADQILANLTSSLSVTSQTQNALDGLEAIIRSDRQLIRSYLGSTSGTALLQNVLRATESPSETQSQAASAINISLQAILADESTSLESGGSIFSVIEQGLYDAGPHSVSVPTLVELALKVVSQNPDEATLLKTLPDPDRWLLTLQPFLRAPVASALAISNPLGSAVYLIEESGATAVSNQANRVGRDDDTYPPALRIALFILRVLGNPDVQHKIIKDVPAKMLALLRIVMQLANDELGLAGANNLWLRHDYYIEEEMTEFVSDVQHLLKQTLRGDNATSIIDTLQDLCPDNTALSFYAARSLVETLSLTLEDAKLAKSIVTEGLDDSLKSIRKERKLVLLAACLAGYNTVLSGSAYLSRTCNELIANLTGLEVEQMPQDVLEQLILLNGILKDYGHFIDTIAKQRIIFFVKHVMQWLQLTSTSTAVKAEVFSCLVSLLPLMADIYGEHWEVICAALPKIWTETSIEPSAHGSYIPLFYSSLRLFNTLGSLNGAQDSNEDLQEAWAEADEKLSGSLLMLLTGIAEVSDENNQPLRTVNELLARQISAKAPATITEPKTLLSLLAAKSVAVQHTAYELLHKHIPRLQEQVSLDAALDNVTARLPDELLSLLLEAPPTSYDSTNFERAMPSEIRTYLSSWLLVFDHFTTSSDRVKADYSSQLKGGGYLDSLLGFMFTFLGHADNKPIDASKFDVAIYDFDLQDSPVKDAQWLLSHLYFLCLRYMASLTKTWWLDSKSRLIRSNVESWTEKYISPHIISSTLEAVSSWASTQDSSSDEALVVKTNPRTHEVSASKDIDGQMMTMAVRLPDNFPLGQAIVDGHNRVAVDEKRWNAWLINCRGVIAFSDNSIVEGIIAFRRNVAAALKGQTECAICYSLVSADKQLPTKKCGTCKNSFHASCLYRWFKSSNSSSCPLCRTSFNYG